MKFLLCPLQHVGSIWCSKLSRYVPCVINSNYFCICHVTIYPVSSACWKSLIYFCLFVVNRSIRYTHTYYIKVTPPDSYDFEMIFLGLLLIVHAATPFWASKPTVWRQVERECFIYKVEALPFSYLLFYTCNWACWFMASRCDQNGIPLTKYWMLRKRVFYRLLGTSCAY